MQAKKPVFYGWYLAGIASFCYGFGISPMYYSWGFFLPEMQQEFALSDTQSGLVFSVFSYIYHLVGPLVGIAMARLGIRWVVTAGAVVGVVGFWLMSRAESFTHCLFAFGVLGGLAIGFSTILPCQTLASNWFVKYRARAIAIVLSGGAVVGYFINKYFGPIILEHWSWRTGWLFIAGISALVAVVAAIFVRGTPEEIGQRPDGQKASPAIPVAQSRDGESGTPGHVSWTASQALRTYQFYILVGLTVAYSVPWSVITVYGRLHLEALGFSTAVAGSILGWRVLVSVVGRLSGSGGDFISPQRLLGLVLLIEGLGSGGLILATSQPLAYVCVILIGLGFGAAYVSVPVTFSSFYGRTAFGTTSGARFAIVGLLLPAAPTVAGLLSDWSGSYSLTFLAMMVLCLVGASVALWLPRPILSPRAVPGAA